MDKKTRDYRAIQFDRVKKNDNWKASLKIKGGEWGDGETVWLNVTNEEVGQIRAILTGTAPLTIKEAEGKLALNPASAEYLGVKIAEELKLTRKRNGRYDLDGGDKTDVGLAKTVLYMFSKFFKGETS